MNDGILEIVDYVGFHRRTTWERRQLLDSMYLNSSKRSFDDFYREAKRILKPDGTIEWFLKNHPDAIEEFLNDVETKYASKLADAEVWELAALREKAILAKKGAEISCNSLVDLIN